MPHNLQLHHKVLNKLCQMVARRTNYALYADQPYTTLTVHLSHPDQDYDLALYSSCPGADGQARHVGQARHMGEEILTYNVGPNPRAHGRS